MSTPDAREHSGRHRAEAFVAQVFHALNDVMRKMHSLYYLLGMLALAVFSITSWVMRLPEASA